MSEAEPPIPPESLPKYLRNGLPNQSVERLVDAREFIDELIEWQQRPVEDADPVDDEDDPRGTVIMEKVTCGDETCKCMREGKKHGPYKYVYYRKDDGTLTSEYIGKP